MLNVSKDTVLDARRVLRSGRFCGRKVSVSIGETFSNNSSVGSPDRRGTDLALLAIEHGTPIGPIGVLHFCLFILRSSDHRHVHDSSVR